MEVGEREKEEEGEGRREKEGERSIMTRIIEIHQETEHKNGELDRGR